MSSGTAETLSEIKTGAKRRSGSADFLRRLIREKPLGTVGAVIFIILLFTGIFADWLAPYGMNETNMSATFQPTSVKHLLGTDNLGRDILSRVIYGARVSMIIGLAASTIATVISTALGTMCGFLGGKLDLVVQRVVDAVQAFPGLILLIVVMSFIGPGTLSVIVVLGLLNGIGGCRIVRGAAMAVKENTYVAAAQAVGCSTTMMLWRHILPNVMAPVIIQFTARVPGMILTEASLSFLGYGVAPPTATWGAMVSGSARTYMFMAPWMIIWPGLALAVAVYGINMFGDAVRDLLDPRLRGGIGRYKMKRKASIPGLKSK